MPRHLSFKLDPAHVAGMPEPAPAYEIWVYSPRVEGVHLRFGAVARGGLRWSDRREDFRTEVLGLVRAQVVKNAVIVPTGAKGGFVGKQLPDPAVDRDAWWAEGIACYRTFITGLLDVTDDLRTGEDGREVVVPPDDVVRYDGDDPYLVVAADKGTATFSDIANEIAISRGFWLGDAFASGGSNGYDHKAMGITARGAWESVRRHFRELGVDPQTTDVTVVGVGDMSGDVFGNGMLLSEHIRLVAAFDHRHVFLDPDPDPAASFRERQRLFALPRSSWADYDTSLLSPGGGVHSRKAKSVPISPQVAVRLGLPEGTRSLSPDELVRAVLEAPVDLFWNGGIGTYVKAAAESHAQVGDKANDAVRVDGADLRVRVVGEGGNLGLTQRGRIEAARSGVHLNTDAVDNSAGVDCSDHEVNIKIMLDRLVAKGELDTDERNARLRRMTDDVARLVLNNNDEQNRTLSVESALAADLLPAHRRFLEVLEGAGAIDRGLEALPSAAELDRRVRDGDGLSNPELSVLLAHAKISLRGALLEGDLPDEPWVRATLCAYFPTELGEGLAERLAEHPLSREIAATVLVNDVVAAGGLTFAFRAAEETGSDAADVVRAFAVTREVFGLGERIAAVERLDGQVPAAVQVRLRREQQRLLDRAVRWFLQARPEGIDVEREVERFGPDPRRPRATGARAAARPGPRRRARRGRGARRGRRPPRRGGAHDEPAVRLPDARRRRGRGPDRTAGGAGRRHLVRGVRPLRLRPAAHRRLVAEPHRPLGDARARRPARRPLRPAARLHRLGRQRRPVGDGRRRRRGGDLGGRAVGRRPPRPPHARRARERRPRRPHRPVGGAADPADGAAPALSPRRASCGGGRGSNPPGPDAGPSRC